MREITIDECLELRKEFEVYCSTAEQHGFPTLIIIDMMMCKSLANWRKNGVDQKEARSMFRSALRILGRNYDEYKEVETPSELS